ncbi:MAG: alanyl-tRNA editing protein [Oscillospiraceae bacterium]|jgi:alanyl-tRNA synthetase|nr:alanyl-tRNA editing protein [Oscillospiraceae bacterium]
MVEYTKQYNEGSGGVVADRLYYVNTYQTAAQARVCTCVQVRGGWEITLDASIFYPTGGGQPCDFGKMGAANVLDVRECGDAVIHLCDAPLAVGELVLCSIDWKRRFDFMQQHSGEHIVSGLIHARFGYENIGFHMGGDVITIDFSGQLSPQELREIEEAANEVVWRNLPVEVVYPNEQELKNTVYRSKKELTGQVRLVRFAQVDFCACCGTHVSNTGEIGVIKLLGAVHFRGGSRVEMLCGARAYAYLTAVHEENRKISNLLSAKQAQTFEAVSRLAGEHSAAQYRVVQLENALFSHIAAQCEGDTLRFEPEMQPDSLRRLATAIGQRGFFCAVFAGQDGAYKYALCKVGGDLRELTKQLNAALRGRGGGKDGFAQGSACATRAEITAFFESPSCIALDKD